MAYTATKASTKQKGHVWFLVFLVILVVASLLINLGPQYNACLLYTSDAADDLLCVDLGGRRLIKKKNIYHLADLHDCR